MKSNSGKHIIMDQQFISRVKSSKCSAGINNPRCSRVNLRRLSSNLIEKIYSLGYNHQLDETMRICSSCQSVIQHSRTIPNKKRRSDERSASQNFEYQHPSTSGLQVNDMEGKNIFE